MAAGVRVLSLRWGNIHPITRAGDVLRCVSGFLVDFFDQIGYNEK